MDGDKKVNLRMVNWMEKVHILEVLIIIMKVYYYKI